MSGALDRLSSALAERYRIEQELGAGGMATVYLAHDVRHDRKVAIKVLRPELAAVIGAERFLREIKTVANLQHPHILGLIDSGEVNGTAYYVMPFVEGESLRDRLSREKQLPVPLAVRWASEIAAALDYAHRHGVIHRDIKPENILLHDGSALVADFGIALAVTSVGGSRMTETGMSLGTPHYMSPEQAMGEREIGPASDVYALGAVTFEMLAGEPPFTGPTAQAIVARVMTAEPPDLASLRKTVPEHVAAAVDTALQKLPADRFPTATAFAQALGAPGPTTGRRVRAVVGPVRRSVPLFLAIGLAALALVLGGLAAVLALGARRGDPVGVRVAARLPAGQEFLAGRALGVAIPPDGSGVLYLGPGVGRRLQYWFRQWDRIGAERLTRSVDEGCCASYSPSGDTIAYLSAPRSLNLLPLNGGQATTLSDSGLLSVTDWWAGLDWSKDGWLYAGGSEGLLRIDPRTGAREIVARHDSARGDLAFLWPQVLPGGKGAVVTVVGRQAPIDPERASIGIVDFSTGRVRVIQQGIRAIYASTGHLLVVKPNGVLWAVPFDPGSFDVRGTERELRDTLAVRTGSAGPGTVDLALDRHGTLVYVAGGIESFRAVMVDRSGAVRPLSDDVAALLLDSPALSSDGRRLAIGMRAEDRTSQIWVHAMGDGAMGRLTFDGLLNIRPRWRPGTGTLSYLGFAGIGKIDFHVFERDAGGRGGVRRIFTGDPRSVGSHAWSPDGRWLIFRTDDQAAGNGDILAIRPGVDTVPRALVATPAEEMGPAVSPDGRWLAYTSNETGRREVYVRPFPATDEARFLISPSGGMTPVWARNGRELFYLDASGNMVAVPVEGGDSFRSGSPEVLFPATQYFTMPYHPQYDVTPDGQRFVMLSARSENLGLVLVTGFLADLERRMETQ